MNQIILEFDSWQSEKDAVALILFMLDQINAQMLVQETGADRTQLNFEWCHQRYMVFVESLSESCWMEPASILAKEQLADLYQSLTQTALENCNVLLKCI